MLLLYSLSLTLSLFSLSVYAGYSTIPNTVVDVWIFISFSVEVSTSFVTFYENGVNIGTFKFGSPPTLHNSGTFYLGCGIDLGSGTTPGQCMSGQVANFQLFNRVVTSAEIGTLYNTGYINNAGLMVWYMFK